MQRSGGRGELGDCEEHEEEEKTREVVVDSPGVLRGHLKHFGRFW